MIGALGRVIRDLRGDAGPRFAELLTGQVDAAVEATLVIESAILGDTDWSTARPRVQHLEHEGDRLRGELVAELRRAIVTPLDREDLFRVSRSIDDVLDNLRDLLRECELFSPERPGQLGPMLTAVRGMLVELRLAAGAIAGRDATVASRALAAKKRGNEIRRLYDDGLAALFRQPFGVETVRVRELLRRLDIVGLRLDEAADALADAAVKRSEVSR